MREQDFDRLRKIARRLKHGIITIDGASALGKIITIDGASALGKSTTAHRLGRLIGATVISTDSYATPRQERTVSPYDPACFRLDQLVADILRLQRGETIMLGEYDHQTGRNGPDEPKHPTPILIIEGVHSIRLRDHLQVDLSVFLDAPEDVMRTWRKQRDNMLGNTDHHWNTAWREHYKAFRTFILPQRDSADTVVTICALAETIHAPAGQDESTRSAA